MSEFLLTRLFVRIESKLLFDADLQPILERAEDRLASIEAYQKRAQPVISAPGGIIGPDGRVINALNYFEGIREELRPEPYDFSSIIVSKLSDRKMESFGRKWLYERMYEWIVSPSQRQPKSKLLLVTGEPVRPVDRVMICVCENQR